MTLFGSLFLEGVEESEIEAFENAITPDVGILLVGAFHIVVILVLFSVLVAMMTKSFESIEVS